MPINPLVLELLEKAFESGLSAEDVCRDRPDLLHEVRSCLRQLATVRDEVDALFPEEQEGESAPSISSARPEIPGYSVGEVIGRGGMGVVYKARHLKLNRTVAVKVMLNGAFAGPPELARFQHEAEALAALEHPNIVQVHDVGEFGGLPYFTMEFVGGGNLAQKLEGIPLSAREAVLHMIALADAVEAAHRGGIVHRDLKPSNVLLTAGGTPKITDFGLARRLEAGPALSMTAMRIGTPGYMAPEQVAGHSRVSGVATDIYSLGAIFYEMLTGRPPFRAETATETDRQVLAEEPAPPSRLNAKVPRDLETICLKCLRKEPRRRYSSSAELKEEIERFSRGEPIKARPVCSAERAGKWMRRHPTRTLAMLGSLAIAIATLVGGWWTISERSSVTHRIEENLRVATQALRRSDWGEARSALERARGSLRDGEYGGLRRRLNQADRDLDLVARLAAIRLDRVLRASRGKDTGANAYEKAFGAAGVIDLDATPRVAADQLEGSEVKDALVAAIDDWTLCSIYLPDNRREPWLLEVARLTDPDPSGWRGRLRDPSMRRDKGELANLADSAKLSETPVNLLAALGELLQKSGGDAIPFLLSIQREHPDDFWVNHQLGFFAEIRNDVPESLRNLQAALATRPNTPYLLSSLGRALARANRMAEAIPYHRKAVQLAPEDEILRMSLGAYLMEAGRAAEAAEHFEKGLEITQDASLRQMLREKLLGCRLQLGDTDKAIELWRTSLETNFLRHEAWDGYAELCLFRRRSDDYLRACRGLLEHFGATEDAFVAERTGRACLLTPTSSEVLQKATALIDRALADKKPELAWARPYFMVAKGLAEYRRGRLESAIAIMDGPASAVLQPAPRLISAMALHRLGREEEAQEALAAAIDSSDWETSHANDRERWIYHILRREAEAMMLPQKLSHKVVEAHRMVHENAQLPQRRHR